MGIYRMTNIGSLIKPVTAVAPQSATAAVNGVAVNRDGLLSAELFVATGAASGSPTTISVVAKLQDSADGSTGWADFKDLSLDLVPTTDAITAINSSTSLDINLSGAKKFVRAVVTPAFTGGTTPAILLQATLILGGAHRQPA